MTHWITASESSPVEIEQGFTDKYGQSVDAGFIALGLGGAILEGTREDVITLLENAIEAAQYADEHTATVRHSRFIGE